MKHFGNFEAYGKFVSIGQTRSYMKGSGQQVQTVSFVLEKTIASNGKSNATLIQIDAEAWMATSIQNTPIGTELFVKGWISGNRGKQNNTIFVTLKATEIAKILPPPNNNNQQQYQPQQQYQQQQYQQPQQQQYPQQPPQQQYPQQQYQPPQQQSPTPPPQQPYQGQYQQSYQPPMQQQQPPPQSPQWEQRPAQNQDFTEADDVAF